MPELPDRTSITARFSVIPHESSKRSFATSLFRGSANFFRLISKHFPFPFLNPSEPREFFSPSCPRNTNSFVVIEMATKHRYCDLDEG
jgi:hypothetical protein